MNTFSHFNSFASFELEFSDLGQRDTMMLFKVYCSTMYFHRKYAGASAKGLGLDYSRRADFVRALGCMDL
jgi:hypothetical protein